MSTRNPVIFLAFANDRGNQLDQLVEEEKELLKTLDSYKDKNQNTFLVKHTSFATINDITDALKKYRRDIVLFHYSGHADSEGLFLEGEKAQSAGLAEFLGKCPQLKLVVLNGCSTGEQVKVLQKEGVKAVIATSAPIGDVTAKEFASDFYQELISKKTIAEAYEEAISETKARKKDLEEHRGILLEEGALPPGPLWGLFGKEDALQQDMSLPPLPEFKPNELLVNTLWYAMAKYIKAIGRLKEKEEEIGGTKLSLAKRRNTLLKYLASPISSPLKKLLASGPDEEDADEELLNTLGPKRLAQLIFIHDLLIELVAFILIAELGDILGQKGASQPELSDESKKMLGEFFKLNAEQRNDYNFFPLIRNLLKLFADNKIEGLVKEIQEQAAIFNEDHDFFFASKQIELIKQELKNEKATQAEIEQYCIEAEEFLAVILKELAFLSLYTMTSVKDIKVLKYRFLNTPKFIHKIEKLGTSLEEELPDRLDNRYLDAYSVLIFESNYLRKVVEDPDEYLVEGESLKFVNLTPFIVDENVMDETSPTVELLFFDCNSKEEEYNFRPIRNNRENVVISAKEGQKKEKIRLKKHIDDQFRAFEKKLTG